MKRGYCVLLFMMVLVMSNCRNEKNSLPEKQVPLLFAAAASLEQVFEREIIPLFEQVNPDILVKASYDSSGRIATQIEQGMPADLFMSASMKQMDDLSRYNFVNRDDVMPLLGNEIVLITPISFDKDSISLTDIPQFSTIALGDPDSVPAGFYAKEILVALGIWPLIQGKISYANNVTEVLHWVSGESAELGFVYATDAALLKNVKVMARIPPELLQSEIIYPIARINGSEHPTEADIFIHFLQQEKIRDIFRQYGFNPLTIQRTASF